METIIFNDRTGDVQKVMLDILDEPIRIVDYSDKSFAVYGSTREFKTELLRLGGKFVPHLEEGAGWIFSKKHYEKVSDFVNKLNQLIDIKVLSITVRNDDATITNYSVGQKLQIIPITEGTFHLVGDTRLFEDDLIELGCQKVIDEEQVKWYFTRNKLKAVNALKNAVNKLIMQQS